MKKKTPLIKASKKQRVKLLLMSGKKMLRHELDKAVFVTNSPELIRQLRLEGMVIDMKRVPKKKESGWQGLYSWVKPKKVSKIETRAYMNNF